MSILIKGMEMPQNCDVCGFKDGCECSIPLDKRPFDCPLIEVPEDIQPVEYGEWTAEGNDEYGNYWDECTACRKAVWFPPFVKNDYKYCPHCGAKMDGET